jgi:hypothetical protein
MSFRSPKYCLHFAIFALLTVVTVHFVMGTGLSYVNRSHCYRAYMGRSGTLSNEYAAIYDPLQPQCQQLSQ